MKRAIIFLIVLLASVSFAEENQPVTGPPPAQAAPPNPDAQQAYPVRILSVNGNPVTASGLSVHPGEVVSLTADVLAPGPGCTAPEGCPQSRDVEEFIWSADDRPDDTCDPLHAQDCLGNSSFQLNDKGISFYVPYALGPQIKISVRHRDYGNGDSLVVHNAEAAPLAQTPPTVVVTEPEHYTYKTFAPSYALAGMGRWVVIEGMSYWVPYSHHVDWVPYQHGYWSWVNGDGWTWVSYDPWGWYTDHYGIWRHHLVYGWIWVPFPERVYHPHVVTFFYTSGHIGWYPYFAGWAPGYHHDFHHGFDDGYWAGYRAGRVAPSGARFTFGVTVVANKSFTAHNVYDVRAEHAKAESAWRTASANRSFAPLPGKGDPAASRAWVEKRAGGPVPVTQSRSVTVGNTSLTRATPVHPVPPEYRNPMLHDLKTVHPVGSVVTAKGNERVVIPPSSNGRTLLPDTLRASRPAPVARTQPQPPVRTKTPLVPHPDHPFAQRATEWQHFQSPAVTAKATKPAVPGGGGHRGR